MATTADERLHSSLSQSQLMPSSISSLSSGSTSNSKLCSQTYKAASQLFLTRRLQEALLTLEPIITVPGSQDDDRATNGEEAPYALAPIATATSTVRIKTWNLYITLLSNIIDLGPEEVKKVLGQKEWKTIANKAKEGEIWGEIVRIGYRDLEGSVDADVVYNMYVSSTRHPPFENIHRLTLYYHLIERPYY
jgi:sodium/bile acid cotransporter 7